MTQASDDPPAGVGTTVPQTIMTERRTAALGAALVAIGPITMALYTPAMPVLVEAFNTTDSLVKLTLTAYFTGFAVTQLICGPLTDAFGRKVVTLTFLIVYLLSTVLATLAPSIEWMIVARTMQGVGAAIGVAVSRAFVRDQFVGQTSARIMNAIAMMLAIGPALAPTIGGITLELFGWREIFWAMTLYGLGLFVACLVWMRETNPHIDRHHLRPGVLLRNYLTLLTDPRFLQPSILAGFGIGTIYMLATVLPFILIEGVGLTPVEFGFGMMVQSGSFISGTVVTSWLLKRVDATRLLPFSLSCMALSGILMAVLLSVFPPMFLTVMGPVGLFAFSLAMALPAASTAALHGFPKIAGAASAMLGFLQFGAGLAGSLVAAAIGDPRIGMILVPPAMLFIAVGTYGVLGWYNAAQTAKAPIS